MNILSYRTTKVANIHPIVLNWTKGPQSIQAETVFPDAVHVEQVSVINKDPWAEGNLQFHSASVFVTVVPDTSF